MNANTKGLSCRGKVTTSPLPKGAPLHPVIIGITGASGAVLAKRCIESLLERSVDTIVVCTPAGQMVWKHELEENYRSWIRTTACKQYGIQDVGAPIASGTVPIAGMAIIPCSMDTLGAVANGLSGNLLERAADVTIKESRPLIIVPREAPLSVIHLTNLLTLARLGVKIMPPMPPFYAKPKSIEDIVEHIVARVLVALGIEPSLPYDQRYGEGIDAI